MKAKKEDEEFVLPLTMRISRRARVHAPDRKAWWYIGPNDIGVYIEAKGGGVCSCTLTREQLERAIVVMKSCE